MVARSRATHCHSAQMLIPDFEEDYTDNSLSCYCVIESYDD